MAGMKQFIPAILPVIITCSLLFSSCALPAWEEQIPSQIEGLPSKIEQAAAPWMNQFTLWVEQIPSQVEELPSKIEQAVIPLTGQFTAWFQEFNNQQPVSYIGLVKPELVNQGDTVSFNGHGIDVDGEVVAWIWRSDIDGELSTEPSFESNSLSVGEHFIYFKVQDNEGRWSEETQGLVQVLGPNSDLPSIGDFSVYPSDIRSGDSTTVYWNVAGATDISIEPAIGSVPPNGSRAVILDDTTAFRLTAGNVAGSVTETRVTNVTGGKSSLPQDPVINYFNAGNMVIVEGEISSLSWSVSNAESVTIEPSIGLVPPEGYQEVCPSESLEYTLTAVNKAGIVSKSVLIGVAMTDQFTISNVKSSASIVSGIGKCPSTLNFDFLITASGAGIITYYIESSTGVITPTESLVFEETGIRTISANMIVAAPGEYNETLHIVTPEVITINSRTITVTCEETYNVTDVFCASGPLSGARSCPFTLFYTFGITADGPCIVFYHFIRSDGVELPSCTITFSGAGTRNIDFSWIVDEPGVYWVELVITSPDSMSAVSEVMNLTCE
jgi:hypothetical protein